MLNTICVVRGFHIVFERFNVDNFHISLFYNDILLVADTLGICMYDTTMVYHHITAPILI